MSDHPVRAYDEGDEAERERGARLSTPEGRQIASPAEYLDGMLRRLRSVLKRPEPGEDDLVEIMSIYNDLGFVCLFLEGSGDTAGLARLSSLRWSFNEDPGLRSRLLEFVTKLSCVDPGVESARQEYVRLCQDPRDSERTSGRPVVEALAELRAALGKSRDLQSDLLKRLSVDAGSEPPAAVFGQLISGVPRAETRDKLALAWQERRDHHLSELTHRVDRVIAARHLRGAAEGHRSALARSLLGSRTTETDIELFLERCLRLALRTHRELRTEVGARIGMTDPPMIHAGWAIRSALGNPRTPRFPLNGCLDFAFAVTRAAFGLTIRLSADDGSGRLVADVHSSSAPLGRIVLDLWQRPGKSTANHTVGIRNRTDWNSLVQRPVSYLTCSFPTISGAEGLTPRNVHSLFHEFGHALNHLLIRDRLPHAAGLERLPAERIEWLSLWFEKWVYHPEFARFLSLTPDDIQAWKSAGSARWLEYRQGAAEQAVAAAMDFEAHRRRDTGGLTEVYAHLDERHGISDCVEFGRFPEQFARPVFTARPGLHFSYLWGAAESAETFAPYQGLTLDEMAAAPSAMPEAFTPCFDTASASRVPETSALQALCDTARLPVGHARI
ncbi:M3 family metallopeptidase [Streptomyces sp. NPDC051217]|uniref:M3 family metallopeptidase n=1 Tax=Streptomyces sp. NPDC051217 TaxID=3365644 RepID=UPI0037ABBF2C